MAEATRARLIRSAHDLFYREGFRNVGVDRILADVGVTKTTFYNHFESKDDLVLDVLRWYDHWWRDEFVRLLRKHGGDTPRGQLLALPDAFDELFRTDTYNGCFFVNVAVEFPLPHEPAHEAAVTHKTAMQDIIQQLAGYAGARSALEFAQDVALIMEGAYVSRQITRRDEVTRILRRVLAGIVDRHLPPVPDHPPG